MPNIPLRSGLLLRTAQIYVITAQSKLLVRDVQIVVKISHRCLIIRNLDGIESKNESNQEVTRKIERRTALRSNELVVLEIDVSAQEQLWKHKQIRYEHVNHLQSLFIHV